MNHRSEGRHTPRRSLTGLTSRLREERQRLSLLNVGDLDIRTTFSTSYAELKPAQARAFRLLALTFDSAIILTQAAALMADEGERPYQGSLERHEEAEDLLADLAETHLIEDLGEGRYWMHDLIRLFAKECLDKDEAADSRRLASERLVAELASMAVFMGRLLNARGRAEYCGPEGRLAHMSADTALELALLTFDEQRDALVRAVAFAAEHGLHGYVIKLSQGLSPYLTRCNAWDDAIQVHSFALRAAEASDDKLSEAYARADLGIAHLALGQLDAAEQSNIQAVGLFREVGERLGEANALGTLATVHHWRSQLKKAILAYRRVSVLFRDMNDVLGESQVLGNLATVLVEAGRRDEASEAYGLAIAGFRRVGEGLELAQALSNLAVSQLEYDRAAGIRNLEEARDIFEHLREVDREVMVLRMLASAYDQSGQLSRATLAQRRADELSGE